ncbi:tail fiber assembly protein [Providencia rettgeri]|uniref:tail fiber assembly protein n=1 Tax=Providencia rettgeri TaxID=587 RepID=UPI002060294B|nr:tail fiber assembly protein [Providencia rettgeri]UPS62270.1 tail fiber assembly protein [Providencia rettgeri]
MDTIFEGREPVIDGRVYFSASTLSFFLKQMIDDGSYECIPDDAVLLTDAEKDKYFKQSPPENKVLGAKKGKPVWVDIIITAEQLIAIAEQKKKALLVDAASAIAPLQDAVDLGIATDKETSSLNVWKTYRVDLNRVDTTTAPDIEWPVKP